MKYKILATGAGLLLSMQAAIAQNEIDAYRMSQSSPSGTALSLGMGGVGGSMGGDMNGLSINPAGIGVYRGSEVSFTPSLRSTLTETHLNGDYATGRFSKLGVDGLGVVMHSNLNRHGWKSVSFGISLNTLANHNYNEYTQSINTRSSVTDVFSAAAKYGGVDDNGAPPYGFLGYQGYLLDDDYNSIVPVAQGLQQSKLNEHRGRSRELNLSLGGNYAEKIMIGMALGITFQDYVRNTTYQEKDISGNINNFSSLSLHEYQNTTGAGLNVKAGLIYLPVRQVRLGIAVHSPTWLTLNDLMDYSLESNTENYKADMGFSDVNPISKAQIEQPYSFDYNLRTPWKMILSGTYVGRNGMLSADYEMVDYSSMRYNMGSYRDYEMEVNRNIKETFGMSHILRVGGEAVLGNLFLRAGGALHSSPFVQSDKYRGDRADVSIGGGFRFQNFFIDLGYMHSVYKGAEYLYNASPEKGIYDPFFTTRRASNYVALTLGFKARR